MQQAGHCEVPEFMDQDDSGKNHHKDDSTE
jgi:hypothetical protein